MKRFTILLVILISGFGIMAQNNSTVRPFTSNFTPKSSDGVHFAVRNVGTHQSSHASSRSGGIPVVFNYDSSDAYTATQIQGGDYQRFDFQLNSRATDDSSHFFQLVYAAVNYDMLLDANTQLLYPFATTPVVIDSIHVPGFYSRNTSSTSAKDTLIVNIYATPTGLTVSPHAMTGSISDTILHSDTLLLDSTLTGGIGALFPVYPSYTLPLGTKFAVAAYYYPADPLDTLFMLLGGADTCGHTTACIGKRPSPYLKESKYEIIDVQKFGTDTFYTDNTWSTILTTNPGVAYDCNNDGTFGGAGQCEEFLQNVWLETWATITPVLSDSIIASATTACPNATITLTAVALGGTPITGGQYSYNYSWTGGGLIQNPNDSVTQIVIPDTMLTGTIHDTLTVTDSTGASVVKTVTITVKGIHVVIGNDTSINCGSTLILTAHLTGSAGGANETWTGPSTTQQGLNFNSAGPGTYIVSVSNSAHCTAKDTITISLNGHTGALANFELHTTNKYGHDTVTVTPCANVVDTFKNTSVNTTGWSAQWSYTGGSGFVTTTDLVTTFSTAAYDTVTLTMDTVGGCSVSYSKPITVLDAASPACLRSGINGMNLSEMIKVFPNPTTGLFNVNFAGIENSNANISVYDIVGRNIYSENNFAVNGNETKVIDLSNNSSGIYFVKVQVNGQPYTVRVSLNK